MRSEAAVVTNNKYPINSNKKWLFNYSVIPSQNSCQNKWGAGMLPGETG